MIEFTLTDGGSPPRTNKTFVMLDQVTHVKEGERGATYIYFTNGSHIMVWESIGVVEKRIREYAEEEQRQRIEALVDERINADLQHLFRRATR